MTPSPQQQAFYNWIQHGTGSCVLEAVAGSGKTTTLINALTLMPGSVFFGAYNKKIADEIKARAPARDKLFISTMHAAGFKAWKRQAPNCVVDDKKCLRLLDALGANPSTQDAVLRLVSLAKQSAFGVRGTAEDWEGLIDHFDIDCGENPPAQIIAEAKELLRKSVEADARTIDFDDMIYAPLVHNARIFEHDWVLIDEAQDTNASRRALALRLLRRGGRLVAVGDRHQAIYGFTGADADSLGAIGAAVSAKEMPLTVSFRCPQEVVRYAQQWVSHIEAASTAPAGIVRPGTAAEAAVGDAVLCRFNKPLITQTYEFIAAGKPAKVEGREIGNGLKALARRWKVKNLPALEDRLGNYLERETAKLRAKERESAAVAVEDKVQCLLFLIGRQQRAGGDLAGLLAEIDNLFADEGDASNRIILSSIHKSKGREWARVFWLQTGPSPWARMDWELDQENNLCYVAATRAKAELVLVNIAR